MGEEDVPTPEEIAEQIRQINVGDLLVSTVTTLGQLAYVKLGSGEREQARVAIDAVAGVLPALEGSVDDQLLRDLKQLLANVRLAYASTPSDADEPAPAADDAAEPEARGDG